MEEAIDQEPNDQEEINIFIESLYDTFVKYLNPEVIINSSSWIDEEHRSEFLQNQPSRESAVQNLIGWILDDDIYVSHFTATLRKLTHDESDILNPVIIGGTDEEQFMISQSMKYLINIFDRSLTMQPSLDDMICALNKMMENKIITEKVCQHAKEMKNPHQCCLVMLKNIKKGKPDWPLVFFHALMTNNLDLMQPRIFDPVQPNEDSQMAIAIPSEIENGINQSTVVTTLLGRAELTTVWDDFSDLSSSFSSITSRSKVFISKDQLNAQEYKILIGTGNLAVDRITSDPSSENQNRKRQHTTSSDCSDDEAIDEVISDTSHSEETPSLNLRDYQKELSENALKGRNTIICAPTGSGKTRVATHIILNHLQQDTGKRKVAFLARTVPLVLQQCKSLKKYLPKNFEVTSLTGDSEDSMHLHMILPDNDVIVMTPRILENHLKKKCLPHLGVFSMLVFDECHHTRKEEPYNTLMYSYLNTKKQITDEKDGTTDIKLPQIVGLTASISVEKAVQDEQAVKCILQVCGNLDADSISSVEKNIVELKATVPVPEEKLLKLKEIENDEAVHRIIKIMEDLEMAIINHAQEIKNEELKALLKKIPTDRKSQQYGQWAVKIRNIAKSFPRKQNRETIGSVRALIIIANYLSAYNVALELHELVLLEHVLAYLDKSYVGFSQNEQRSSIEDAYFKRFTEFKGLMTNRLYKENPNLTSLKKTLSEYLIAKGGKSCGIIFVRTRALTEALASWLNSCDDENLRKLKATVFTGTGASVEDGGMTTAEQDEVLQRFKSGDVRLLVATSVGEEGIDIPECNLVIKYNHVGNEVTTMQTRGRSRKEGGMSILLAMDKIIRKERINQEKAKMMERAIKQIRQMKRSRIRKMNKVHQLQIMKDEEIHQIVKQQEESMLVQKNFQMVCHLCRKVVIDSKDIKTIFQTHHVVVNRNILSQTRTIPYNGAKYIDEIKMIGSVRCMGEPEEGKYCYNKLGSMMVYSKIPFVVLGIKNFGFDSNEPSGLEFYNQWKKVPYAIDEIGPSDFKRYLPESSVVKEIDDETDDDDDSDGSSDHDDDIKRDKPRRKRVKPNESSNTEHREVSHLDKLGSTPEQKREPSLQGVGNPEEVNKTEPKMLLTTSDTHGNIGIVISGKEFEGLDLSASSTEVKGAHALENLESRNIIKSKSSTSTQPLQISSFRSDDNYHNTKIISSSLVERNELRIANHRLLRNVDKILNDAPTLESKLSIMTPLSEAIQPLIQESIDSESEAQDMQLDSIPEIAEEANRSSDESVEQANRNSAESVEQANINSAESVEQENRNSINNIEDRTKPKELLSERNENVPLEHGQSGQNNDGAGISMQQLSGLNLL